LVVEDKNALMTLMGIFDEKSLPENINIENVKIDETLLNLTPSELLLSRPDIKAAEHKLKSANADIGAARAAFFPSITLTGSAGFQSSQLSELFHSETWIFNPQINVPIFTAGRGIANLKRANLLKKIEIANYEKAIQTAFTETSNELAQRESTLSRLNSFTSILKSQQKSYDITKLKYKEGIASKPTVIANQVLFLTAKQNQATLQKEYLTNLIKLYKVLGGGSELE
jgi:multidrug efflux system outer membrane protein